METRHGRSWWWPARALGAVATVLAVALGGIALAATSFVFPVAITFARLAEAAAVVLLGACVAGRLARRRT